MIEGILLGCVRKLRVISCFLLVLLLLPAVNVVSSESDDAAELKPGMWWKLRITQKSNIRGEGQYRGIFQEAVDASITIHVESVIGNSVRIVETDTNTWFQNRSGIFTGLPWSTAGSSSEDIGMTIDRSSGRILTVERSEYKQAEGRLYEEWMNPRGVILGSLISRPWFDQKVNYVDAPFAVSETKVQIRNFTVDCWHAYRSAEGTTAWSYSWVLFYLLNGHNMIIPNSGHDTKHYFFDKVLGILVGAKLEGECDYGSGVNSIRQEWTSEWKLADIVEYQLTVKSQHGQPNGEGSYPLATYASFSVQPSVRFESPLGYFGVKYVFDHWSGDADTSTSEAAIFMDSSKTVEAVWRIDWSSLYIVAAIVGVAVALLETYRIKAHKRSSASTSTS